MLLNAQFFKLFNVLFIVLPDDVCAWMRVCI
jgi:hypothetical protein